MKRCFKYLMFAFILLFNIEAFARTPLKVYDVGGLQIISYSSDWVSDSKLEGLYNELLENVHGDELNYLSKIYIYNDSPYGVRGYYNNEVYLSNKGTLTMGKNSNIELFNGGYYDTVSKMASALSHEYGHHFTLYHILNSENKYYSDWGTSRYANIRNLSDYSSVLYDLDIGEADYLHQWDVAEIAANDYVQLMGSGSAKNSEKYMDIEELLYEDIDEYVYYEGFNMRPQENLSLPLATQIEGLYDYFSSFTDQKKVGPQIFSETAVKIEIVERIYSNYYKYKISWNTVPGMHEYTAIMFPKGSYSDIQAIKTVYSGEKLYGIFGSILGTDENGTAFGYFENYSGEYEFRVFAKDKNGYIYSSEPYFYNFTLR